MTEKIPPKTLGRHLRKSGVAPSDQKTCAPADTTPESDADIRVHIPPPIEETQKLADAGELVAGTLQQDDLSVPENNIADADIPDDATFKIDETQELAGTDELVKGTVPQKDLPALKSRKKGVQRSGTTRKMEQSPESLPVLTAFQQFLDKERRRMRARIFTLIMFFTAIMLLGVAGILLAARVFQTRMQRELNRLETDIANVDSSGQSALSRLQAEAVSLRKEVDAEKSARKDLSGSRAEIEARIDAYAKRLDKVLATTEVLQVENTTLQTRLEKLKEQIRLAATSDRTSSIDTRSSSTMALSIMPRGGKHARQWRVPIPE
jgi:hypothetical protein